jgi:Holliday junction resolvasome RuvABC DNA-binding subunit
VPSEKDQEKPPEEVTEEKSCNEDEESGDWETLVKEDKEDTTPTRVEEDEESGDWETLVKEDKEDTTPTIPTANEGEESVEEAVKEREQSGEGGEDSAEENKSSDDSGKDRDKEWHSTQESDSLKEKKKAVARSKLVELGFPENLVDEVLEVKGSFLPSLITLLAITESTIPTEMIETIETSKTSDVTSVSTSTTTASPELATTLVEMGFFEGDVAQALKETSGSFTEILQFLLSPKTKSVDRNIEARSRLMNLGFDPEMIEKALSSCEDDFLSALWTLLGTDESNFAELLATMHQGVKRKQILPFDHGSFDSHDTKRTNSDSTIAWIDEANDPLSLFDQDLVITIPESRSLKPSNRVNGLRDAKFGPYKFNKVPPQEIIIKKTPVTKRGKGKEQRVQPEDPLVERRKKIQSGVSELSNLMATWRHQPINSHKVACFEKILEMSTMVCNSFG